MHRSTRILVAFATVLAASLTSGAAPAGAQCPITGPTTVCPGSTIDLCGPATDNAMCIWQGPGGSAWFGQCITISEPGAYQLVVQDMFTGNVLDSCTAIITAGGAAPAITGPASTCSGTPAAWCGPSGNFEYAWSGPNGFAATTACVSVGDAGEYQLRVRPLPDGCWSASAAQSLAVNTCTGPPTNCPRSAAWWADAAQHDAAAVGQIAACVDEHDSFFSWSSPGEGFRSTLAPRQRTLRLNAARQVAAVRANVCAGGTGWTRNPGLSISLDPATVLSLPGATCSIATWLANADLQLARLATRPEHSAVVNAGYRQLIATAWSINHGVGIGPSCARHGNGGGDGGDDGPDGDRATSTASAAAAGSNGSSETLSAELVDESAGPLAFGELFPNPFSATTSLGFAVSTGSPAEVSIGVYDVSGRLVRELARGTYAPGRYEERWDGHTSEGAPARSGTYFILGRIGGEKVQTRVALVH